MCIVATSHWVGEMDDGSMGTHSGPASHWVGGVDNSSMGTHTLDQHHIGLGRLTIALWGHTHWTSITLGWGG